MSFYRTSSGEGHIAWDGALWHSEGLNHPTPAGANAAFDLHVIVDLQVALLLRLADAQHRPRWLWVSRKRCPERWLDLRRAVYGPARSAALTPYTDGSDVMPKERSA